MAQTYASQAPRIGATTGGLIGNAMVKPKVNKVARVMHEFKAGKLHSGSKNGPVVASRRQAVAIALSEARRARKA